MNSKWLAIICVQVSLTCVACHDCGKPEADNPFWFKPCKSEVLTRNSNLIPSTKNWHNQVRKGLRNIKEQLRLTKRSIPTIAEEYAEAYHEMERHNMPPQPPTWIPAQGNIRSLRTEQVTSLEMIVQHIPGIYTDLQKFAVAFEHLSNMEENSTVDDTKAFKKVVSYLAMLLCEINSSLEMFAMSVPPPIQRSIMPQDERKAMYSVGNRKPMAYVILTRYIEYTKELSVFLRTAKRSSMNRESSEKHNLKVSGYIRINNNEASSYSSKSNQDMNTSR